MRVLRTPMQLLQNQKGLSLVEVLLSVVILSFISLSIMGYFVQSVESSTEDSRRIVAIKLADQTVKQIRNYLADKKNELKDLSVFNSSDSEKSIFVSEKMMTESSFGADLEILKGINFSSVIHSDKNINGIDYHYMVEFLPGVQSAFSDSYQSFTVGDATTSANLSLLKFRVIVFWGVPENTKPPLSEKKSISLDSYVVFRR